MDIPNHESPIFDYMSWKDNTMSRIPTLIACILFLIISPYVSKTATIRVPEDYESIQEGIDAATDGDTVLVASGTYAGPGNRDIDFFGRAVTVRSAQGAVSTTIDCEGAGRGFYFHKEEEADSRLEGFTIANGEAADYGGGIHCASASPTIVDCVIENCTAEYGGGIRCHSSSSSIIGCVIRDNDAEEGGGVDCSESNLNLEECTFESNFAINGGGIAVVYNSYIGIYLSEFTGNIAEENGGGVNIISSELTAENTLFNSNIAGYGGAMYSTSSARSYISHCTFSGNEASSLGGAIYCTYHSHYIITSSILWGDSPSEIDVFPGWGTAILYYSNIEGGWPTGIGSIDADPRFADSEDWDFHLLPDSPCIDTGLEDSVYVDIDGDPRPLIIGFDMGIDELLPTDPRVAVIPDSFPVTSIDGEPLQDDTLLIISGGAYDLDYEVTQGSEPWLLLSGDLSGLLAPGDTGLVLLHYDETEMRPGWESDEITVASNDPWFPEVSIPVVLEIYTYDEIRVPDDEPTIQSGINYALDGATVLVAPGTYSGQGNRDIDFLGKAITVLSENGSDETVIDCETDGRGFNFHNDETEESRLEGFTIRRGSNWESGGGGIYCYRSSPTIVDCLIEECTAGWGGGGIYCNDCTPTLMNCVIKDNRARTYGGGVYGSPVVIDCVVTGNEVDSSDPYNSVGRGGGIYGSPTVVRSIISNNVATSSTGFGYGGGLYGEPALTNCIISGNFADQGGGGVFSDGEATVITHCTFSGNDGDRDGGGIYCDETTTVINSILWGDVPDEIVGSAIITFSDIEGGWTGEGNIDEDPLFEASDDFHLQPTSPCVDAGNDAGVFEDIDSDERPLMMGFDIGADEVTPEGPSLKVIPSSFYLLAIYGEEAGDSTLTLESAGTEDIEYEIEPGSEAWLTIEGELIGALPPGESATMNLKVDIAGLLHGEYFDTLTVFSNDWLDPEIHIPVKLIVFSHGVILVPDHFSTMQEALDAADDGDTILVGIGTFSGPNNRDMDFHGKTLNLLSTFGPENTVIDCGGSEFYPHRGFRFHGGEDQSARLEGFTIRNGYSESGGGILCEDGSSPKIIDCIITENGAITGGGIACDSSGPHVARCFIQGNTAEERGGGIFCSDTSSPLIVNCTISGNTGHTGGGVYNEEATLTIAHCTLSGNIASSDGGGFYTDKSYPLIANCILWGDKPQEIFSNTGFPFVRYSDVEGGFSGQGNIDADPRFLDPALSDYHLYPCSPCVDAGTDVGVFVDIDGDSRPLLGGYDIGFDEVNYDHAVVDVEPDSFELFAFYNEQPGEDTLHVVNLGIETLWYKVTPGTFTWIELAGDVEGGILSGDTALVYLLYDITGLEGVHRDTLIIINTDPNNGSVPIPVKLEIYVPRTLRVPEEYGTIQEAIGEAQDGDTVLVADGTYSGEGNTEIDFGGREIVLKSDGGADYTLIDGNRIVNAIRFTSGEGRAARFEGFTVKNGYSDDYGGGIFIEDSSPTIAGCTITGCSTSVAGGGFYCTGGSPLMTECIVEDNISVDGGGLSCLEGSIEISLTSLIGNYANRDGGGLHFSATEVVMDDCDIFSNLAVSNGGGLYSEASSLYITSCIAVYNNSGMGGAFSTNESDSIIISRTVLAMNTATFLGGSVYAAYCSPIVTNCTICWNTATLGGAMYGYHSYPIISNSIIWGNSSPAFYAIQGSPAVTYSDIQGGWAGEGNLDAPPRFVDVGSGDLSLMGDSPCIGTGDPSYSVPYGGGCRIDMGAYEFLMGFNCGEVELE